MQGRATAKKTRLIIIECRSKYFERPCLRLLALTMETFQPQRLRVIEVTMVAIVVRKRRIRDNDNNNHHSYIEYTAQRLTNCNKEPPLRREMLTSILQRGEEGPSHRIRELGKGDMCGGRQPTNDDD